jgi:hypothetical protein
VKPQRAGEHQRRAVIHSIRLWSDKLVDQTYDSFEQVGSEKSEAKYQGHTDAFARILDTGHDSHVNVGSIGRYADDLMQLRDDELVLLGQVRAASTLSLWPEALSAEVARRTILAIDMNRKAEDRNTAALVDFKLQAATASGRLETLTGWPIVFTMTVVLLTVVLVVHDLTR